MSVLCEIADSVDGAQAVVSANATDDILLLLESQSPSVRLEASKLAGRLARHESTAEAVLKLRAGVQLASFLRYVFFRGFEAVAYP